VVANVGLGIEWGLLFFEVIYGLFMKKITIGFVGVGRMGANMARHLKDSGYDVTVVYDVNADAASEVAGELGARCAGNLCDVTAGADVIVTVVTDDAAMREVFTEDGLLKGAEKLCDA